MEEILKKKSHPMYTTVLSQHNVYSVKVCVQLIHAMQVTHVISTEETAKTFRDPYRLQFMPQLKVPLSFVCLWMRETSMVMTFIFHLTNRKKSKRQTCIISRLWQWSSLTSALRQDLLLIILHISFLPLSLYSFLFSAEF